MQIQMLKYFLLYYYKFHSNTHKNDNMHLKRVTVPDDETTVLVSNYYVTVCLPEYTELRDNKTFKVLKCKN